MTRLCWLRSKNRCDVPGGAQPAPFWVPVPSWEHVVYPLRFVILCVYPWFGLMDVSCWYVDRVPAPCGKGEPRTRKSALN